MCNTKDNDRDDKMRQNPERIASLQRSIAEADNGEARPIDWSQFFEK